MHLSFDGPYCCITFVSVYLLASLCQGPIFYTVRLTTIKSSQLMHRGEGGGHSQIMSFLAYYQALLHHTRSTDRGLQLTLIYYNVVNLNNISFNTVWV